MSKLKKIAGGCGEDNHVGAFYDFIYTAHQAHGLYLYHSEKIKIVSNQKIQDVCKKNITQFAFPKNKESIKLIETARIRDKRWVHYFLPKEVELDFYWVSELDWIMKLDWIEDWEINNELPNILEFIGGTIHIRTGELSW